MLFFLNAFDGAATCLGMGLGHLSEDNPLLAQLSHLEILAVKLIPISLLILFLYKTRKYAVSQVGTVIALCVYVHIFLLHAEWIGAVL